MNKAQNYYLEAAGLVVKITLQQTDQVFYKDKLKELIREVWGKGGFLTKEKKHDFEIVFKSRDKEIPIVERDGGRRHFYLISENSYRKRRITTYYHASFSSVNSILKSVFSYLLSKDGLMLHASSCVDLKGDLYIFMAKSGGGKSTAAKLFSKTRGIKKVTDDVVFAKRQKGKWLFYTGPFVEKDLLPRKRSFRKAKIFFVKKTKAVYIRKIKKDFTKVKGTMEKIWLYRKDITKHKIEEIYNFAQENDLYFLGATLTKKDVSKAILRVK